MSDWRWEIHPDDLLDNLPPEALKEFTRIAHEITVRDSMIYLDGKDFTGSGPGLRQEASGTLLVSYLTDVRGERVVFLQVSWYGLSEAPQPCDGLGNADNARSADPDVTMATSALYDQ